MVDKWLECYQFIVTIWDDIPPSIRPLKYSPVEAGGAVIWDEREKTKTYFPDFVLNKPYPLKEEQALQYVEFCDKARLNKLRLEHGQFVEVALAMIDQLASHYAVGTMATPWNTPVTQLRMTFVEQLMTIKEILENG